MGSELKLTVCKWCCHVFCFVIMITIRILSGLSKTYFVLFGIVFSAGIVMEYYSGFYLFELLALFICCIDAYCQLLLFILFELFPIDSLDSCIVYIHIVC